MGDERGGCRIIMDLYFVKKFQMTAIGIRAFPKEIIFSIVNIDDRDAPFVISSGKVLVPVSLNLPEKLNYIRKTFKDIIFEFDACCAGIRITESNAQGVDITRISFEAILQELLSSSSVKKYFIGQISSISARLKFRRENFKEIVSKDGAFKLIDNWNDYSTPEKESILVALAAR